MSQRIAHDLAQKFAQDTLSKFANYFDLCRSVGVSDQDMAVEGIIVLSRVVTSILSVISNDNPEATADGTRIFCAALEQNAKTLKEKSNAR